MWFGVGIRRIVSITKQKILRWPYYSGTGDAKHVPRINNFPSFGLAEKTFPNDHLGISANASVDVVRPVLHFSTAVNILPLLQSQAQDVVPHTCPACVIETSSLPWLILLHKLLSGCTNETEPTCSAVD